MTTVRSMSAMIRLPKACVLIFAASLLSASASLLSENSYDVAIKR